MAIDDREFLVDRSTQAWVRATGTVVSLDAHPWLRGPTGGTRVVGDEWLASEAERLGGAVVEGGGLLDDMDNLAAPGFDPARLAAPVGEFHQRASAWRLEAWSRWSAAAWPFGCTLSTLFAGRPQQPSLPVGPWQVAVLRFHYRLEGCMDAGRS